MSQKTVLVIEDSPELADSIADVLEMNGHVPLLALSGRDGIELAHKNRPDLIILDIRLPDMDGYQIFQAIRADGDWGASAKVLILTASESIENISKNIDVPVKYVLFKPELSVTDLTERINERITE